VLCWATFGVHLQVKLPAELREFLDSWLREGRTFPVGVGGVYRETAGQLGSKERPGKVCVLRRGVYMPFVAFFDVVLQCRNISRDSRCVLSLV
jgi:hypothetical protein